MDASKASIEMRANDNLMREDQMPIKQLDRNDEMRMLEFFTH